MDRAIKHKHIKIIAILAIVGSILTILSMSWLLVSTQQKINAGVILMTFIASIGIYGGWLAFQNQKLGKKILVAFFIPQLISVFSSTFFVSFYTGISLSFTNTSSSGVTVSFNVYALVMLLLCIRIFREHDHLTSKGSGRASAPLP